MAKKGRPLAFKRARVISLRLCEDQYLLVKELAETQSLQTGRKCTEQGLIRDALRFCYEDDEMLREVFRRIKGNYNKRLHKKA
jgi:hypothetical protein